MMEDWTDIIGEELESIEEPLPADDWSVLQQKYAAARRREKLLRSRGPVASRRLLLLSLSCFCLSVLT